jgi:hypothetical protein
MKETMMRPDQKTLVDDLRRKHQGHTADRVQALNEFAFERFKRDLLRRHAADGVFA